VATGLWAIPSQWAGCERGGKPARPTPIAVDPEPRLRLLPQLPITPTHRPVAAHSSMRPPPATIRWLLPILASLLAGSGCRLLGTAAVVHELPRDAPVAVGGRSPTARRTIPLEVLFIRSAADDVQLREAIWDHVDEQAIPAERRRALNANGLRVGVVTGQLPAEFAARLAANSVDEPAGDVVGIDPGRSRRQLQLLPGRRSELVTATRLPSLVLLEQCAGEVRGGTFHDATPLLALAARPAADGRVKLEAVPEIKHGPVEKSWAGEDGMFRLEAGQRRHRLDHLAIDVTLPTEALLLVGCAGEPAATVGDGLLRDQGDGEAGTVRLIVIRPLARSADPAFAASGTGSGDSSE